MSRFLTELDARVSKQMRGKKFIRVCILDSTLEYESDLLGRVVVVPECFPSDGASVPRFMWAIYPPFGAYLEAAVVHDFFCVSHEVDSVTAANVFLEAMEACGVSKWRRRKMYFAVRWFGPKFSAKKV